MITKRIKSLLLFAGIIAVLGLVVFVSQSSKPDTTITEHILKRQQAEQQLAQAKKEYERTVTALTKKVDELSSELQKIQVEGKVLKVKYVSTRQELLRHVAKEPAYDTVGEIKPEEIKQDCDSMKEAAILYIEQADSSIINLEQQVSTLEQLSSTKDSTVAATDAIYHSMEARIDQMQKDEKKLVEIIRKNEKRERRRKFFRKVEVAGLFVLSGVVTSLVIQSK